MQKSNSNSFLSTSVFEITYCSWSLLLTFFYLGKAIKNDSALLFIGLSSWLTSNLLN